MNMRDIAEQRKKIFSRYGLDRNVTRCVLVGLDYDDSPRVSGRDGFVWAKEYNADSGAFQAFNPYVQARVGLIVLVAAEPKPPWRRMIIDVDWSAFLETADSFDELSFQPEHAVTHEFPDGNPGADVVFIYPRALTSLRLSPMVGLIANVNAGVYIYENVVVQFYGENIDLTPYVPATDGNSVWVTIYIDPETNSLGVSPGLELSYVIGATYAALPNNVIPIAFVLLTEGDTIITEAMVTDARPAAAIGAEDVDTFLYLLDTPDSYTGQANKFVSVRGDEAGLEFSDCGSCGGSVVDFLDLTDTPDAYAGYGEYLLSVKSSVDGVEFSKNRVRLYTGTGSQRESTTPGESTAVWYDTSTGALYYWNGSSWQIFNTGSQAIYYLHTEAADVATYQQLLTTPANDVEDTDTAVVNNAGGEVLIKAFVSYPATGLGTTIIIGGAWHFACYAKVDSAVGTSQIVTKVYKRTSGGVETLLFSTTSPALTAAITDVEHDVVEPDFIIDATDRLVVKYYGKTTSVPNRTITLYYEGTTHYTHIHTPIMLSTGGGVDNFLDLTDTPDAYTGYGSYLLSVKSSVDGVEFVPPAVGGIDSFLDLTDTPDDYASQGGKVVAVKTDVTGLEFIAIETSAASLRTVANRTALLALTGNTGGDLAYQSDYGILHVYNGPAAHWVQVWTFDEMYGVDVSGNTLDATGTSTFLGFINTATLKTISGGYLGRMLMLKAQNGVTLTVDETDNIILGAATRVLDSQADRLLLQYDYELSKWVEVSYADNA